MRLLRNYDWPGNVRQLLGVIERAAVEAEYGRIEAQHLPADLRPAVRDGLERARAAVSWRKRGGRRTCRDHVRARSDRRRARAIGRAPGNGSNDAVAENETAGIDVDHDRRTGAGTDNELVIFVIPSTARDLGEVDGPCQDRDPRGSPVCARSQPVCARIKFVEGYAAIRKAASKDNVTRIAMRFKRARRDASTNLKRAQTEKQTGTN